MQQENELEQVAPEQKAPDFHREADKNNRTVMVLRWIQRCVWRFLIVDIKTLISWDFNTCVLLI